MKQSRKLSILAALGLFASAAASQAATLTINGCDTLTVEADGTITCNTVAPPPPVDGAPTGCTVAPPSVALPVEGGRVGAPTVSCTGGPTSFTTTWASQSAAVTFPVDLPANASTTAQRYTYTGSVCAGSLCTTVSFTATVAANATTPPTTASCGNLKVIPAVEATDASNKTMMFTGQRYSTTGLAGPESTIAVVPIVVPSDISGPTTLSVYVKEGLATYRKTWLSKSMCDTSATAIPYRAAGLGTTMKIQVGGIAPKDHVPMFAGETWYLMVKNEAVFSTKSSCTSGDCDVSIKLYKP